VPFRRHVDDGRVSTRPVRDFDFHPDEAEVRVFAAEPAGVLRSGSDVYVSAARYGDVVLWHYAFGHDPAVEHLNPAGHARQTPDTARHGSITRL
jgi:hypothetical protein